MVLNARSFPAANNLFRSSRSGIFTTAESANTIARLCTGRNLRWNNYYTITVRSCTKLATKKQYRGGRWQVPYVGQSPCRQASWVWTGTLNPLRDYSCSQQRRGSVMYVSFEKDPLYAWAFALPRRHRKFVHRRQNPDENKPAWQARESFATKYCMTKIANVRK